MNDVRYVKVVGTFITKRRGGDGDDSGSIQLLLGSRVHVDAADEVDAARDEHGWRQGLRRGE